jgi:metallo-beta-lactamase class B
VPRRSESTYRSLPSAMKNMTKVLLVFLSLVTALAAADPPKIVLTHLRGSLYVVEDYFYSKENSMVYVGDNSVTVIGATWSPETATLLAGEVAKITRLPIKEVIDTNYHPDRAGGNAYFKSIGAEIVSTKMTRDLLELHWDEMIRYTQKAIPSYPAVPLVIPDRVFPGDFELQRGRVKGIYLGPAHTADGIFVYFPEEKVLYGNCILKEQLGNLDFADRVEYPKTLQRLRDRNLGFTTIVAGHWSPIHGPELIDRYLQLLDTNTIQAPVQSFAEAAKAANVNATVGVKALFQNDRDEVLLTFDDHRQAWEVPGTTHQGRATLRDLMDTVAQEIGITYGEYRIGGLFTYHNPQSGTTIVRPYYRARFRRYINSKGFTDGTKTKWFSLREAKKVIPYPASVRIVEKLLRDPARVWGGAFEEYGYTSPMTDPGAVKFRIIEDFYQLK